MFVSVFVQVVNFSGSRAELNNFFPHSHRRVLLLLSIPICNKLRRGFFFLRSKILFTLSLLFQQSVIEFIYYRFNTSRNKLKQLIISWKNSKEEIIRQGLIHLFIPIHPAKIHSAPRSKAIGQRYFV